MDEHKIEEQAALTPDPGPTPEQQEEYEKEAEAARKAVLAPYLEAARQRQETAQTAAEHDVLLSDMLYELTLVELGEEV